eukprot:scaffold748_cov251-Pinguiococcus_pyrenoidosus.AAC.63
MASEPGDASKGRRSLGMSASSPAAVFGQQNASSEDYSAIDLRDAPLKAQALEVAAAQGDRAQVQTSLCRHQRCAALQRPDLGESQARRELRVPFSELLVELRLELFRPHKQKDRGNDGPGEWAAHQHVAVPALHHLRIVELSRSVAAEVVLSGVLVAVVSFILHWIVPRLGTFLSPLCSLLLLVLLVLLVPPASLGASWAVFCRAGALRCSPVLHLSPEAKPLIELEMAIVLLQSKAERGGWVGLPVRPLAEALDADHGVKGVHELSEGLLRQPLELQDMRMQSPLFSPATLEQPVVREASPVPRWHLQHLFALLILHLGAHPLPRVVPQAVQRHAGDQHRIRPPRREELAAGPQPGGQPSLPTPQLCRSHALCRARQQPQAEADVRRHSSRTTAGPLEPTEGQAYASRHEELGSAVVIAEKGLSCLADVALVVVVVVLALVSFLGGGVLVMPTVHGFV